MVSLLSGTGGAVSQSTILKCCRFCGAEELMGFAVFALKVQTGFVFAQDRYNEIIRGSSGVGKTTLNSQQIGRLVEITGRVVHLFVPKGKRFETVPKYQRWIPDEKLIVEGNLSIAEGFLRERRGSIFVVEDLAYYGRKNKTPENVRRLVVALGRANDIFTVVVTQSSHLHNVSLIVDVGDNMYEIHEGKGRVSEKYSFAVDKPEMLDSLIGAVFDGLPGKEIGIAGRLVVEDSLRQRVFRAKRAGLSTGQIVKAFSNEKKRVIYQYVQQCREEDRIKFAGQGGDVVG